MKIVKMTRFIKVITFGKAYAICLAPFGIYIDDTEFTSETINHEMIHWEQQKEVFYTSFVISIVLGGVFVSLNLPLWVLLVNFFFPFVAFYLWYAIEWLIKYLTPPLGAYHDISFEREAFFYADDPEYIATRKHFAWLRFISNKFLL